MEMRDRERFCGAYEVEGTEMDRELENLLINLQRAAEELTDEAELTGKVGPEGQPMCSVSEATVNALENILGDIHRYAERVAFGKARG